MSANEGISDMPQADMQTTWRFFDPNSKLDVTHRRLPHWEQPGVCYFLTFRTADSLPAEVCDEFRRQRQTWLLPHGIDTTQDDWHALIGELPVEAQRDYHKKWSREFHRLLDLGYGACHLASPDIAADCRGCAAAFCRRTLRSRRFCRHAESRASPGRVFGRCPAKKQCFSWKHFTAREINLALNHSGHFWQGETYDHIVRSEAEFLHYQRYIAENPTRAGLRGGFVLHSML